jgi:competence ComEA-like helix-hairpin-helix protein
MEQRQYRIDGLSILLLIAVLFGSSLTACVKLPHRSLSSASQFATPTASNASQATSLININTAPPEELERLPGIGRGLAARIISYREQYGRFRRAEHLILVRGIGERRFRRLRPFITV